MLRRTPVWSDVCFDVLPAITAQAALMALYVNYFASLDLHTDDLAGDDTQVYIFFAAALLRLRRCPSRTGTRRRRWVFPLFFFSPLLLQRRRIFFLQAQIL